jgi:oligopeptide/dipeptide ABC transporter ATP-binding protein
LTGDDTILEVEGLEVSIPLAAGILHPVRGVSFSVKRGETFCIVGESGCGKSLTLLAVMDLLPARAVRKARRLRFGKTDLAKLGERQMGDLRGDKLGMIFQDPMTSLNPVFKTGWQVGEPLRLHKGFAKARSLAEAINVFKHVGIPEPEKRVEQFPHEFSGGMRQRAMIAMGLTTRPSILIADEPTTALDVTIQAQILDLLRHVVSEYRTATILITHNLGVVAGMCDRLVVMYAGRVVEQGPTEDVFASPKHPYTWSLLRSIPRLDAEEHEPLRAIEGLPPDLINPPSGCRFHPRCPFRVDKCSKVEPPLGRVGSTQHARCWVTQEGVDLNAAAARTTA